MRIVTLTSALVALAASTARAQPVVSPGAGCEVRFVRVPDDVRGVIERWISAEPRCTGTIDLRVISTYDGYYLIAQRPDGRLHDRLVPDAESAGVLVASWVADDWVTPGIPSAEIAVPQPAPRETLAVTTTVRSPSHHDSSRWLSFGPLVGGSYAIQSQPDPTIIALTPQPPRSTALRPDGGLRGEIDLVARGNWTLGTALAWTRTRADDGRVGSSDYSDTLYGAYSVRSERWELRAAIGAGIVYSEADDNDAATQTSGFGSGFGATATASLAVTRRLGDHWGLTTGLLAHAIVETLEGNMPNTEPLDRRETHLFVTMGLRRELPF